MISFDRIADRMFPSIVAGGNGVVVATPEICSYKSTASFKPKKEINARNFVPKQKQHTASSPTPTLPHISREGSFTSFVSSRSTKSNWREKRKKLRGRREEDPEKGFTDVSGCTVQDSSSISTTELELDCKAQKMECGLPVHVQNPRFLVNGWASAARSHFPQMRNTQMMQMDPPSSVTSQRIARNTSRVTFLKGKWQVTNAKNPSMEFVGVTEQATLNERYKVPLIRTAPNHKNKLQQTQARDVATTTSHRRCSCHRHRGDSSEETRKPQSTWERLAGTPQASSDNLFKTEARLFPTDSSTTKRQQASSKGLTTSLRRRTKKITLLTSDSTSSVADKRKNKRSITSTRSKSDLQRTRKTKDVPVPKNEMQGVEAVLDQHNSVPDERMEVDEAKSERSGPAHISHESVERVHEHLEIETVAGNVLSSSPHSLQRALTPRLLQVNPDQLKGFKDASALAREFQQLDCDCDGHLSFKELMKSLPKYLSKKQTAYLKKIYDRACKSTFFGLEEFMAAHQLCYFVEHASPALTDAYSKLDFVGIESWLQIYMELFSGYDKSQKGVISVESLQKLLVSANVGNGAGSPDTRKILNTMRKGSSDSVTGVEVLAYIPYFVAAFPSEASRTR